MLFNYHKYLNIFLMKNYAVIYWHWNILFLLLISFKDFYMLKYLVFGFFMAKKNQIPDNYIIYLCIYCLGPPTAPSSWGERLATNNQERIIQLMTSSTFMLPVLYPRAHSKSVSVHFPINNILVLLSIKAFTIFIYFIIFLFYLLEFLDLTGTFLDVPRLTVPTVDSSLLTCRYRLLSISFWFSFNSLFGWFCSGSWTLPP